jgi:hypothetical protein
VTVRTEADAIAAYEEAFFRAFPGAERSGTRVVVRQVQRTDLWHVATVDIESGEVSGGANIFVGPDGQVWPFSSNPRMHDWELVPRVLQAIYRAGVANRRHPAVLLDRVEQMTQRRNDEVTELLDQARRGELRSPREPSDRRPDVSLCAGRNRRRMSHS